MRQVPPRTVLARLQLLATAFAAVAACAAIGAIIVAHLGPDGRFVRSADRITPLTGHVLIGSAAVAMALLLRRFQIVILAASVPVALLVHIAASWVRQVEQLPATAGDATFLRIYAHNSWDAHPEPARLERALLAVEADVLVLTEVDPRRLAMLERLKKRYPYQMSCAQHWTCATAILSRLPIVTGLAARNHNLMPPIAWAHIDASARGLGQVTVVGTHVHRPTRNAHVHAVQMRALAQMIGQTSGHIVLAGDLNAGGWSASFRGLLRTTGLVPMAAFLPTWPAAPRVAPQVALDHILVSPELRIDRSGIGPATGSDHLPVFADIRARSTAHVSSR